MRLPGAAVARPRSVSASGCLANPSREARLPSGSHASVSVVTVASAVERTKPSERRAPDDSFRGPGPIRRTSALATSRSPGVAGAGRVPRHESTRQSSPPAGGPGFPSRTRFPNSTPSPRFIEAAGRDLFLVVATTETALALQGVIDALAVDRVLVVFLYAPPDVAADRVAARELRVAGEGSAGSACAGAGHVHTGDRGIDVVVDTDGRTAIDVAAEVRALLHDRALIAAPDA